jgi:GTP-binding protein HflX
MSGKGTTILINDTIGFIRDLPPELIQAFTSTLEDSVESDLLLHMIDSTDPLLTDKISVVDQILDSIGAEQTRWYVFNKIDQLSVDQLNDLQRQYSSYDGYWVSAHTGAGIEPLTDQLATHL